MGWKMAPTLLAVSVFLCCLVSAQAWSGHYQRILRHRCRWERYCCCHALWWCCRHRYRCVTEYYYEYRCSPGWTHSGNQNCIIPVCRPTCANGGKCINPNTCRCPSTSGGPFCQHLTCSYRQPCYPGNCHDFSKCTCEPGFKSNATFVGCQSFDETFPEMYPSIGRSTAVLADIRRTDNKVQFMYELDATNTQENQIIWVNQKRFNTLEFQFESLFVPPDNLPLRPNYVHDSGFGIVGGLIEVNVSKVSRTGSPIRDTGSFKTYPCNNGATDESPQDEVANCTIYDDQFRTLIEHADWLTVKFKAKSGGFRKLTNVDDGNKPYRTDHYNGLFEVKTVEFRFDFIAPKFCNQTGAFASCPAQPVMLAVQEEFTRTAIRPHWKGWTDDLSEMWEYYIEVFLLTPEDNALRRLVEHSPLSPVFATNVSHAEAIRYPTFTPDVSGIYSVLLTASDVANNSMVARRFAIYDPDSEISLNTGQNERLFVFSAEESTDYQWQTKTNQDGSTTFVVVWRNHFVNRVHKTGRFLNEILPYPIQFQEIEDDGILASKKFVLEEMDDYEGQLTRNGINNFNGITSFEVAKVFTLDTEIPEHGWVNIEPLAETYTFSAKLHDGQGVRVWVRANDVMGNIAADTAYVRVDSSGPLMTSSNNSDNKIEINYKPGKYNYTTRITFKASDPDSGVHKLGYSIVVSTPGKPSKTLFENVEAANMKPKDDFCAGIDDVCYIADQVLDLDNCWFMVAKNDLDTSSVKISVTAFNNAMLSKTTEYEIPQINKLHGLEKYSGPENFRIEKATAEGFRVSWDLPKEVSCYGLADVVLVIFFKENGQNKSETFVIPSSSTFFDILGRSPNTEYHISLGMRLVGNTTLSDGINLAVRTPEPESDSGGVSGGVVAGVAVAVLAIMAISLTVFIILMRRGHFQPVRRGITRVKTIVGNKARNTFYGGRTRHSGINNRFDNYAYDGQSEELYTYGEMELSKSWHIPRCDVTLESVISQGHFIIYKADLRRGKSKDVVVAKMLKVGPMIIYEYCEHGTVKDYLQRHANNVTIDVQEKLLRFGHEIAKGMEYLASRKVVHRRLAARNMLLASNYTVKISGFGPQPNAGAEDDGDAENGKRERIPIKWMPPECMASTRNATEKSDVWSYAVVLWELFSLGATPYENIRSRDLPGKLKKGVILPKPEICDETWYGVMKKCWNIEPGNRPTFTDIRNQLDGLFVAAPGDDYYYYQR